MRPHALLIGIGVLAACVDPLESADRRTRIAFDLSIDPVTAGALAPGPFVSVVDSIDVRATSGGSLAGHQGVRLSRYQTVDSVTFTFREGSSVTFDVSVYSTLGMLLYTGSQTADIVGATLRVPIALSAARPVLAVQPDTLRTAGPQTVSFAICNTGASAMTWTLAGVSPSFAACGGCTASPAQPVNSGQNDAFMITVPPTLASTLFYFDLSSSEGTVRVVWDYTAPIVSSVTVTPDTILVAAGGTVALSAQVVSTGTTAVNWTSFSPAVASVSTSGVVTGIASGSTTIHARSVVDPAKRDSALVRVYTPFVGSWSISEPLAADTVHRDGPGVLTRVISAITSGPTGVYVNPFGFAEFWGRPVGGATWIRLGQSSVPTISDNGITRSYTFALTWNPNPTTAPYTSPSLTRLELIAVGVTGGGLVRSSPLNPNLWVAIP